MAFKEASGSEPVHVIESIPIGHEHGISPQEIAAEHVPMPAGFSVHPELGRGGCGRVHLAFDRYLLRWVALKRLAHELAVEPFYRDGFVAEAQMAGQLEHPNIVAVHGMGLAEDGVPFFTMKLVEGIDFDTWLRRAAPGSVERLEHGVEILIKVCDAIAYAHDRGVIHRDIKPGNIMVGRFGQVYVMDWGLAALTKSVPATGADAQMAAPGAVGTPEYMAPEQARGNPREMDERSDIFGLGAILYQLVSGRLVYGRCRDQNEVLARAREGRAVPIDEAVGPAPISKRIRAIITKATAADPAERYQTVEALADDLRRFTHSGLHLPTRFCDAGEIVIREGDVGDAAYMIASGTCRAYRTVDGGQETLATMTAGDVFGEIALLLYEPRAATVEAVDEVTLFVLDKQTLTEGLGLDGWTGALVRALAHRFRDLEAQVRASGLRRE